MRIWDKYKCTFTDPNDLHSEEAMESMCKAIGLTALDLYQDPQYALKNKMGNFYEANHQKKYASEQ